MGIYKSALWSGIGQHSLIKRSPFCKLCGMPCHVVMVPLDYDDHVLTAFIAKPINPIALSNSNFRLITPALLLTIVVLYLLLTIVVLYSHCSPLSMRNAHLPVTECLPSMLYSAAYHT